MDVALPIPTHVMDGFPVMAAAYVPPDTFTSPGFLVVGARSTERILDYFVTTCVMHPGQDPFCVDSTYDLTYEQALGLLGSRLVQEANRQTNANHRR